MASYYSFDPPPQDMQVGGEMPPQSFAAIAQPEQRGLPVAVSDGVGDVGGEVSVYVGNLSWDVNWQTLKDHFKSAGNVLRANVMMGRVTM